MSLQRIFEKYNEALAPSEVESDAAKRNKEAIRTKLNVEFGTTELLRSGSFGHGTSLRGYSDIDYFAITPTKRLKKDSKRSLAQFRDALRSRFPTSDVAVNDPAVVVPFASYGLNRHEIIPADYVETKSGFRIFEIPNRYSGWMRASPSGHNRWVTAENVRLDGRLKKLVRFLKVWNRLKGAGLRSFYIEMRATEYAQGEKSIFYSIDLNRMFRRLRTKQLASMHDPLGITNNIYPCTEAQKKTALSRLDTAVRVSDEARNLEKSGELFRAYLKWDELFNNNLPHYAS